MGIRVRSAQAAADAYSTGAQGAQKAYADGVAASGEAWKTGASAASETYAAGVSQAIADDRFKKGVEKAGAAFYVDRATKVGAGRFTQGAQNAKGDYAAGVQPYLDVIAQTDLPARRPKGDPSNIQRVALITQRLRDKKLGKI